ncbi:MAG: cation transporter [Acidimicrobiia bacterium]|nr:cation transporter [Acidimicrobiia bacterium]
MTIERADPIVDGRLRRRAVVLAWATVTWNAVEAIVAISAGASAGSLALIGFGLDSTIEVASAVVILWQFAGQAGHAEQRERLALKLIGLSFFALAGYVVVQAVVDLATASAPDSSLVGIGLAALSLVVMPILARAKRRTGRQLGSVTVTADSQQTLLCTYLSAILLLGLGLNAALGWWWADPVAGLAIAALAVREGREAWEGEVCCD